MTILLLLLLYGTVFVRSGGENIALQRETKQISVLGDNLNVYSSQFAVDGNNQQNNVKYRCAHTAFNHNNPWWSVDLGRPYDIDHVIIYGRTDCCERRLADFEILLYNPSDPSWDNYDMQPGKVCHRQDGISPTILNTTCRTDIKGLYLKVSKKRNYIDNADCLTLCEVEVFEKKSAYYRSTDLSVSTDMSVQVDQEYRTFDKSFAEPMCPCACSYRQKVDYWGKNDIPKRTKDEWCQILAPKLAKLDRELRIDKTKLSASRRRKESANDNNKSTQNLGIVGTTFLSTVIALVVYIDVVVIWNGLTNTRRIRPGIP